MTKKEYLAALERGLAAIGAEERSDILLELESHIDDTLAARAELTEEEVIARLPSPEGVAAGYREAGASAYKTDRSSRDSEDSGKAFPFGDADDFFRYARGEPGAMEGEAPGAERLIVRSQSADVAIRRGDALRYTLRGWWKEDDRPRVSASGPTLELDLGRHCELAEITAPPSLADIEIVSSSGDVKVDAPEGSRVSIRTISGDAELDGDASAASIASSSGDVALRHWLGEAFARTASGDVSALAGRGSLKVQSSSGDIDIEIASAEAEAEAASASGDIRLRLPEGPAPAIALETVSGEVSSGGIPGLRRDGTTRARARYMLEGGPGSVRARTISGDASAERAPGIRPDRP
ncbi:MAG: DUF4097 family beta strand repeat protein [Spirochaetes bacterium]|nr:DUF4097 family beta strand repeat protein [Spirochaetota bacterium]